MLVKHIKLNDEVLDIPVVEHCSEFNSRYYVDIVNGSDDNDGTTMEKAFRTLTKFFDMANETRSDIRCYLMSKGDYYIENHRSFVGIAVHISIHDSVPDSDTVRIVFPEKDAGYPFYDCHLNIRGRSSNHLKIGGKNFYMDSGNCSIEYCDLETSIALYGGGYHIAHCTVKRILTQYSTLRLGDITVDGVTDQHAIEAQTAFLVYNGPLTATIANNINQVDLFHFEECNVIFNTTLSDIQNKLVFTNSSFLHPLYVNNTSIYIDRNCFNYFQNSATLGNRIVNKSRGMNLPLTNNVDAKATGTYEYYGNISNYNTLKMCVECGGDCFRWIDIVNTTYDDDVSFSFTVTAAGGNSLSVAGTLVDTPVPSGSSALTTKQTGTLTVTQYSKPESASANNFRIVNIYGVNV